MGDRGGHWPLENACSNLDRVLNIERDSRCGPGRQNRTYEGGRAKRIRRPVDIDSEEMDENSNEVKAQ